MSGGEFEYIQDRMDNVADQIEEITGYSQKTLKKFKETVETLRLAAMMVHRVDWLVSGDDDEEDFHERWGEF